MNEEREKQKIKEVMVQKSAMRRKPYEAPRLIVHGSIEALTKGPGKVNSDVPTSGSNVHTTH